MYNLISKVIKESRQYQLRASKENGDEDRSNWYDEEEVVLKMQSEIDDLDEYESSTIIKRIKEYQYSELEKQDETYTLETKCKSAPALTQDDKKESLDMLKFSKFVTEEMSTGAIEKAGIIILKYLRRTTGNGKIFIAQGLERYKNSNGVGFGLRFYAPGKKIESWRFNWASMGGANYHNLSSIDLWKGDRQGPNFHISFEREVSLVQVLPRLADMLKSGKIQTGDFYASPQDIPLEESANERILLPLVEAVDPSQAFDGVISLITSPNFTKNKVWSTWKSLGVKIFDALEIEYPNLIEKSGRQYIWNGSDKDAKYLLSQKDTILSKIGSVRGSVSSGSSSEKYAANPELDALESQREKLAYTKQLEDLENLIKMTISGASNALFVAGRGGIGKTHTVEKVLQSAGLTDGKGYFKNTGTASAAGIYSLLFKYKDEIILFDDSDDALKDQESRNLIKAATDTKKMRKLVWNKMGKNVVDPDSYDGTDDELIDDGLLPRYYEFTGKIIFISNLKLDKLDPDGAIRTRAFIIEIDPTEAEIYDFMDMIVDKIPLDGDMQLDTKTRKGVVELLRKSISKQSANLRKLSRALNMKAGALKSGVDVSDNDLRRMIETYA